MMTRGSAGVQESLNDTEPGRVSRGYLRAWLGAVTGLICGGIPGVLLFIATRDEGFVFFFVFGGAIILVVIAGAIAGAIGGTYLFLRHARLPAAGRTAWLVLLVVVGERVLDSIVGSSLAGTPLGGVWSVIVLIGTLAAPVIARKLALTKLRTAG
jgi:hypothetical protein